MFLPVNRYPPSTRSLSRWRAAPAYRCRFPHGRPRRSHPRLPRAESTPATHLRDARDQRQRRASKYACLRPAQWLGHDTPAGAAPGTPPPGSCPRHRIRGQRQQQISRRLEFLEIFLDEAVFPVVGSGTRSKSREHLFGKHRFHRPRRGGPIIRVAIAARALSRKQLLSGAEFMSHFLLKSDFSGAYYLRPGMVPPGDATRS